MATSNKNTTNLIDYNNMSPLVYKQILKEYTKPLIDNIFFQNLDYLYLHSDMVRFSNDSWNQRPEMFCQDYYNQHELSPVILTCNRITTFFSFTAELLKDSLIIAPKKEKILQLISFL